MIAKVIVNHGTKAPDKLYDYLVPTEMEDKIEIGTRVKVSFGTRDREVEAYVLGTKIKSNAKRLKSVIGVYDRAFDEKMLPLIEWMRNEYLCTYIDIIKTIVPRGSINKPLEWIILKGDAGDIGDVIKAHGGEMEINDLLSCFSSDISSEIKKLLKSGELTREFRDNREVKSLTVRVVESLVSPDEIQDVLKSLSARAPSQARMMDILSYGTDISVSDLVKFSDGSYSAIRALLNKGYINIFEKTVLRTPVKVKERDEKKTLTDEQSLALKRITDKKEKGFSEFLLHGVTGSGKTEVYLQAIEDTIANGKKAIMLVPEISLTPQLTERFIKRFGERVSLLHSGLSIGERYDEWTRIKENKADIVIGARSAIFAPLDNIGIIILDEEHEVSYKSEMSPRYLTHDIARFRAKQHDAILLLASATPKIETYFRAKNGEIEYIEIKNRISKGGLPKVSVVDMRDELSKGNRSVLSQLLKSEIEKNIKNKEQTILLLNRRGFSTFVSCRSCGYVASCPNCSISLTYHKYSDSLRCHYCGHTEHNPSVCPECGSKYIRYFGGGTQKVEEELNTLFPEAKVIRMDVDTTQKKGGHEKVLSEFEKTGADILIGTQMVAKGLDFPNVTLVGVISADTSLFANDFRSGERTFDLLEQVTGRAGRADKNGRAVIQTYAPEHSAIKLSAKHDYKSFYETELKDRNALGYPPFVKIATVGFSGTMDSAVSNAAKLFKRALVEQTAFSKNARILGPIKAGVAKINNKYRWQIIIKHNKNDNINKNLIVALDAVRKNKNYNDVVIVTDNNPYVIY